MAILPGTMEIKVKLSMVDLEKILKDELDPLVFSPEPSVALTEELKNIRKRIIERCKHDMEVTL